jgi:clan AA aspartic protease
MKTMGLIYADITLINAVDLAMVKRNMIDKDEVRMINVNMLVDSGAYQMAINEAIQEQLDLPFIEKKKLVLADGSIHEFDVVGPILVKFKNRTATCSAIIVEGNNEPLLGAIPMEEMDVLIDPKRQELIVHPDHPDMAQLRL